MHQSDTYGGHWPVIHIRMVKLLQDLGQELIHLYLIHLYLIHLDLIIYI